jgi:hypothetical protein
MRRLHTFLENEMMQRLQKTGLTKVKREPYTDAVVEAIMNYWRQHT